MADEEMCYEQLMQPGLGSGYLELPMKWMTKDIMAALTGWQQRPSTAGLILNSFKSKAFFSLAAPKLLSRNFNKLSLLNPARTMHDLRTCWSRSVILQSGLDVITKLSSGSWMLPNLPWSKSMNKKSSNSVGTSSKPSKRRQTPEPLRSTSASAMAGCRSLSGYAMILAKAVADFTRDKSTLMRSWKWFNSRF